MSNDDLQGMRLSLPPGTKVQGEKGTYIVKKFICMSTRSTTVLCETSNGSTYRLKIFNGQHGVTNAVQRKTAAVLTKGVLTPFDIGEYSGCPFVVYQNIDATDAGKYPISIGILVKRIIPQMAYVLNMYHRNRILLRDICPENILYRVQEQQIAYCGFNNMTILPDKATITKAKGYGQNPSFIAPEVPRYGYSICSDYYSLGVTLLSMMLGKNPMQNMPWEEIQKHLRAGSVPGIDISHLKNTAYEFYSQEDKVLYLVLGLMLPNPKDRWGYAEIQCWCRDQHIPLVRKEGRIRYQYYEPFVVNNFKCWNYQQLSQTLASEKSAWTEETFQRLEAFAKGHKIAAWLPLIEAAKEEESTPNSRIFKMIYGINPALDGFWWRGRKYVDTNELFRQTATKRIMMQTLSEILKTRCLSYFLKMRKRITTVAESEIREMEQIEQWEIAETEKGVNRCIMRFAGSIQERSFTVEGIEYKKIEQLVRKYSSEGLKLKNISLSILKNKNFQAWLWANGMEDAGEAAKAIGTSDPEQSFYLLLKIAERACKAEPDKRMIRNVYLTYGEYGPIFWLTNRIYDYKAVSICDQILYDTFKNAKLSLAETMETLSSNANQLVSDYIHFVSRTAKSQTDVDNANLEFCDFSFYPLKKDGFFNCTWDKGLEVSPAFLKAIGADY